MRTMLKITATAIAAALALGLAACGGDDSGGQPEGANPETYERIESLTDCAELQAEFDSFAAVHDANEAGSEQAVVATDYMRVTDERMQEIGC